MSWYSIYIYIRIQNRSKGQIYFCTYISFINSKNKKFNYFVNISGAEGNASADVDHHLEMGKRLLAAGQLTEALSHYHSAIGLILIHSIFSGEGGSWSNSRKFSYW